VKKVVLVIVLAGAAQAPSSPSTAGAAAEDLTASVYSVDADGRHLEVLTGVGHALRVVAMEVEPSCEIKVEAAPALLRELKPGQIVRIRYRKTDGNKAAQAIETVSKKAEGGGQ